MSIASDFAHNNYERAKRASVVGSRAGEEALRGISRLIWTLSSVSAPRAATISEESAEDNEIAGNAEARQRIEYRKSRTFLSPQNAAITFA